MISVPPLTSKKLAKTVTNLTQSPPSRVGPLTAAKVISGALNAAVLTLVPLLGNPSRLAHPIPWLLFVSSALILANHPPVKLKEILGTSAEGRSGLGILVAGVLVNLAPVIDFGYRAQVEPPLDSIWFIAGVCLLVLGVWLRMWAIVLLGQFFTAVVAVQPGQVVIEKGPYRFIRHPSYTGTLLAAFGGAVMCQSFIALVLTVLALVPAYLYRIAREESWLVEQLGKPYAEYKARSKKLVPFVY
jgi:protein-S-isoprenylcysteine O-methyltransferase Ste14